MGGMYTLNTPSRILWGHLPLMPPWICQCMHFALHASLPALMVCLGLRMEIGTQPVIYQVSCVITQYNLSQIHCHSLEINVY